MISNRPKNWLSSNRFRPVSGSRAVSFRPVPKQSVDRLGAKPVGEPCRFDRFRNKPRRLLRGRTVGEPCRFDRFRNNDDLEFATMAVGEPCRFDRFRNHWTRFRSMAWHFILEPPEKKQASRFADPAPKGVLQVSTRVNSRARRGTEPYSTISASSAASRFPRASGSSSGLFNARPRASGAFLSPEGLARFPTPRALRDIGVPPRAGHWKPRPPFHAARRRLAPWKAGSSGSLGAHPPRRPWVAPAPVGVKPAAAPLEA